MLPPITVPVRQRLDLSTVAGAPNAVNNQDPPQVSQNNSAGTRSTLSTSRRRRLSTPRRPRRSTAIRSGTQEQENNAELNQSSIIDVTEETPPVSVNLARLLLGHILQVSQNNSAGTRSTLSTPRRRRLSTPRRPRRSTAIRSGTQEQENNAELNQSSIIDVTEETPPEVVAAGYRTATGDSPTVLFRTSAPLMVDQMNTHSISIPNQTNCLNKSLT
ncbi:uncharacterized protein LOC127708140 [Mytilus californianus]|uniref:uncharacterized protein LOC127708140 n=1 Tax=Mytilus californianus TaxID=6549 RepID=UPI0022482D13|nr:uncharacterized protein LOC127708140 [Mytilus californianus]